MNRKKMLLSAAIGLASFAVVPCASATILYNPIVTQVGDGNATTGGAGYTNTINLYYNSIANQASPISSAAYNSSASGTRLITTTSATSEGMLSNNPAISNNAAQGLSYSGTAYAFSAGFNATNGTASVAGATANAPRSAGSVNVGINSVSSATVLATQTQATAYNASSIRAATGDDSASTLWTAGTGSTGSTGGWRAFNSNTQVTAGVTNTRTVEVLGSQLFGSAASGAFVGISSIGTGTPTNSGNTTTLMIATGAGSQPYEFVLIDDPNNAATTTSTFGYDTAYVADDRTTAGGIQKWTYNGTTWSLAYTMKDSTLASTAYRGLAGQLDVDTNQVVLWATTGDGTKLQQVTDTGASAAFTTLASAPTNTVFRGVALSPVPEPSTVVLGGLSLVGLVGLAIRRRK